jgi:autotransporter-associated beta strand protein
MSTPSFVGVVGGDNVGATVTAFSGVTPMSLSTTTNAGTYAQKVSAMSNTNYQISATGNTIGNLVINPLALLISGAMNPVTYNGSPQTNNGATVSINGGSATTISGTSVATGVGSQSFTLSGYASNTNAGHYSDTLSLAVGAGTSAGNYSISYSQGILTIDKANLTVTGSQPYNGTATILGSRLTIIGVGSQTFTATGIADLNSKNVQINQELASVNGLILSPIGGASLANYNAINVSNTSVSITSLALTLTAPTISKVYDGGYTYNMTSPNLGALSSQLIGGDAAISAGVVFTGNNPNVGSNKSVSLNSVTINDGNGGANYSITLANSNTSQITAAPLQVSVNNAAKFVTQSDPVGYNGVVYSGFVNGETSATVLGGSLNIARSNASTNSQGIYSNSLNASGLNANNGNYSITYAPGNFIIVPANALLVEVTPVTTIYGSAPAYVASAKYLSCSIASCPSTGSVNVIHTLTPIITGNSISLSDGVGGSASFNIIPTSASLSGSKNMNVGGYQLATENVSVVSGNFSNSIFFTGTLTVNPSTLTVSQLGISGVSKTYNGSSAISGLILNTVSTASNILAGDDIKVIGTGIYNDANVGVNKPVTISVGLTGNDASNYILSNNQISNDIGTITQLASVTYTGISGGNWSNANNWAGGAIPTLSNVANVIIPVNNTVVYDTANLLNTRPISTINNNGVLSFNSALATTLANDISGTGSINQSGAGTLTLTGANSYSGDTVINQSSLIAGNSKALGSSSVNSSGGIFSTITGLRLPSLTINGPVTLIENITTLGTQTYNGPVTLNNAANITTLTSESGNINFGSTLVAGANNQSLTLNALQGRVIFNDQVGVATQTYNAVTGVYTSRTFQAYLGLSLQNLTNLTVTADTILLNGDITTFTAQTYNGNVRVGDNGQNGPTRVLLSEDPSIIINGLIDDVVSGQHNLVLRAIRFGGTDTPVISVNGLVGSLIPLNSITITTGEQNMSGVPISSDSSDNPNNYIGDVLINGNITTTGDQIYTGNKILVLNETTFTTTGGSVTFNYGVPANFGGINPLIGDAPLSLNFNVNGGTVTGVAYTAPSTQPSGELVNTVPTTNNQNVTATGMGWLDNHIRNYIKSSSVITEINQESISFSEPEVQCVEANDMSCS